MIPLNRSAIPAVIMKERRVYENERDRSWREVRPTPAPATPASVLAWLGATAQFRSAMMI